MQFPIVSKELLDALNQAFPLATPRIEDADRVIWRDVGSRRVVDFLQQQHDQQQNSFFGMNEETNVPQ